jgi:hypothetical protein
MVNYHLEEKKGTSLLLSSWNISNVPIEVAETEVGNAW